jgi:hypothetical protein
MKSGLGLPLTAILAFSRIAVEASPSRVLFIGNSYTDCNSLPRILENIVTSTGHPAPTTKAITPGGKTLEGHLNLEATLKLIDEGNWDVVVLQGQSLEAAMAEQSEKMRENFLQGATGLYERIKAKSPKARVVFYETWARHEDYWKDSKALKTIGKNPTEMQAFIRKWYQQAASGKKDCTVAPVGDAWERYTREPRAMRLHAKDHSHPAFNGSYLAALVIYATVYQPSTLDIAYHGSLTAGEASVLQRVAAEVMGPTPP